MKNLTVGERVKVFGFGSNGLDRSGCKGIIAEVDLRGFFRIEFEYFIDPGWFHPRQCVRLKPKRVPREIWVNDYVDGLSATWHESKEKAAQGADASTIIRCVKFVEVLE